MTKKQKKAIIKIRDIFEKYNVSISSEDPFCGVGMVINGVELDFNVVNTNSLNKVISTFSSDDELNSKLHGIFPIIDNHDEMYQEFNKCFDDLSGNFVIDKDDGEIYDQGWSNFNFSAGPHLNEKKGYGYLSDTLSCYGFIKKSLTPLSEEYNLKIDIGIAENLHGVSFKSNWEELNKEQKKTRVNDTYNKIKEYIKKSLPIGCELIDKSTESYDYN